MHTSANIQNQIITIFSDHIHDQIIAKVMKAGWLSVIADKAADSSNKEQLHLVLRYVNPENGFAREDVNNINYATGISVVRATDSFTNAKFLQLAITITDFFSAMVISNLCLVAMLIFCLERLYRISFVLCLEHPLVQYPGYICH